MTKSKISPGKKSIPTRTPHARLAAEAADWDRQRPAPSGFTEADAAVPRATEATAISLRLPNTLLAILKKLAEREGVGYQVLLKRWLDDRVRLERDRLRGTDAGQPGIPQSRAPQFPLLDRSGDASHYQR
ncbi:MAG TPA: CopG family antitoxin [Kofleriaceae bacterium]|jgi:predicted DNA binding CopG/RHH family protein|nr:CopG family antitoxin [Kofleriaceae bacterium]